MIEECIRSPAARSSAELLRPKKARDLGNKTEADIEETLTSAIVTLLPTVVWPYVGMVQIS